MLTIDQTENPMILFLKDGSVLEAHSMKHKRFITTEFFFITHIDPTLNCLTLMLLQPCSLCDDGLVLEPMDAFITMDMGCFCGYQAIPNTCIKRCNHPKIQFNDCICMPFTLLPGVDEIVLWQSNITSGQYGTIKLCIEKGIEHPLQLRLYNDNAMEYKNHLLMDHKLYSFPIKKCSRITMMKSNKAAKVKGVVEIEVHNVM